MTKICDECETVAHCTEHGCVPKQQALDKMAENSRELGLDYEPAQQQEPVACKTLCELCVKRGYHFCANAAQTTPIPSPPASKPWVGLTKADKKEIERVAFYVDGAIRLTEAKLREKNT